MKNPDCQGQLHKKRTGAKRTFNCMNLSCGGITIQKPDIISAWYNRNLNLFCMSTRFRLFWLVCILFFAGDELSAQAHIQWKEIIQFTKANYGPDPLLINGEYYQPKHRVANGHPWLFTAEWIPATLFIHGYTFDQQQVKYDIISDCIVLHGDLGNDKKTAIVLNATLADSLHMLDTKFIRTSLLTPCSLPKAYTAILWAGKDTLCAFFEKSYLATYYNKPPYGKYTQTRRTLWLIKDQKIYQVTSKRDFLQQYSQEKEAIRKFLRKAGITYNKATFEQIRRLMYFCEASKTQRNDRN